jgi:hypothetical protein
MWSQFLGTGGGAKRQPRRESGAIAKNLHPAGCGRTWALPLKPEQFASAVGYCPRNQGFICKQKVEPIGGIEKPVRSRDRNRKTVRCKLARLYHGVDGAGTEVGGAVIVFFSFDDERHVAQHTLNCASHSGVERNLDPSRLARHARWPRGNASSIEENSNANKLLLTLQQPHPTQYG